MGAHERGYTDGGPTRQCGVGTLRVRNRSKQAWPHQPSKCPNESMKSPNQSSKCRSGANQIYHANGRIKPFKATNVTLAPKWPRQLTKCSKQPTKGPQQPTKCPNQAFQRSKQRREHSNQATECSNHQNAERNQANLTTWPSRPFEPTKRPII